MVAEPRTQPHKRSPRISPKDRDFENLLRLASIYRKTVSDPRCRRAQTEGDDAQMLGRVLLLDDNSAVRRSLRAVLEGSVGICGEAENGRQAIDKASELQPDIVVLDLVIPEMNGLEAAYEIRQPAPSSKIIFISLPYSTQAAPALAQPLRTDAFLDNQAPSNHCVQTIQRPRPAALSH